jgi:hypothetical protein
VDGAQTQSLIEAIEVVEVAESTQTYLSVEEARRIPDQYRHLTYFSHHDLWHYIDTPNNDPKHAECEHCKRFRNLDFTGDMVRRIFPDWTIESENMIYPHVHKTLWGQDPDSCKCTLIRVTGNPDFDSPEKTVIYIGGKVEPYKPKKD